MPSRIQCVCSGGRWISQSVFGLIWLISCGGAEVGTLIGRDRIDEPTDGCPQSLDSALGGLAQQRLEL